MNAERSAHLQPVQRRQALRARSGRFPIVRRHPEQIYREAFMLSYCKISIGKRKTIWVPVRQKAPFVPWTIPIETKKIGEYVLPSLTPSDFMESGDEFPPVIKSRGKAKEMKR